MSNHADQLRDCLRECADDLAAELEARYPPAIRAAYASQANRYQRDMGPVYRARALLQELTPRAEGQDPLPR